MGWRKGHPSSLQRWNSTSVVPTELELDLPSTFPITKGGDFELLPFGHVSYTSIKDLLPSLEAGIQSPTPVRSHSFDEISIRNRLVKQAAWAYLQPTFAASPHFAGGNFFRQMWIRLAGCLRCSMPSKIHKRCHRARTQNYNETLIAIKAPHGTTLEVPDPDEAVDYPQRRYRIVLRSTMGPIDLFLVSKFEKFEEANDVEATPSIQISSSSGSSMVTVAERRRGNEVEFEVQDAQQMCSDPNASQDFMSGIMKIVPSDVDADSDYWLLSDPSVSITDMWKTDPGIEWDRVDGLNPEAFAIGDVITSGPQTPPSGVIEVPSGNNSNCR